MIPRLKPMICPNPDSNPYCHKRFDVDPGQPRKYSGLCDSCSELRDQQPETVTFTTSDGRELEFVIAPKLRNIAGN